MYIKEKDVDSVRAFFEEEKRVWFCLCVFMSKGQCYGTSVSDLAGYVFKTVCYYYSKMIH